MQPAIWAIEYLALKISLQFELYALFSTMIILIKLINPSQSIPTFASVNPQAPLQLPRGGRSHPDGSKFQVWLRRAKGSEILLVMIKK